VELGFGCSRLGSAAGVGSGRAAVRLVQEAADGGITLFDTADAYSAGMSERLLGRALRDRRSTVVIATKGGYGFRPRSHLEQTARRSARALLRTMRATSRAHGPSPGGGSYRQQDFSPEVLRLRVEASLRRLRTDYIDVYQLHGPHEVLPDLFERLSPLIAEGKVRRFGVGAESVADAAAWAPVQGLDVLQLPFGVLDPEATDEVFPVARATSIEIWARGVFGGGLLAASHRGDVVLQGEPKLPLINALRKLSEEMGIEVYQLAMDFVRAHADVSAAVVGIGSREHLERNLALLQQPPLSDDISARVRALFQPRNSASLDGI
jgi:aryl-alcohol dehydrogenase-like predicted oxidoreductase